MICVCVCEAHKLWNQITERSRVREYVCVSLCAWSVSIARLIGIRCWRRNASNAIGTTRRTLQYGSREAEEFGDNIAQTGIGIAIARRGTAEGSDCGQHTGGQIVGDVTDRTDLGRYHSGDQSLEILDGHRRFDVPLLVLLNVRTIQLLDHTRLGVQKIIDLLQVEISTW